MIKNVIFTILLLLTPAIINADSLKKKKTEKTPSTTDMSVEIPADMERNYDELLNLWAAQLSLSEDCMSDKDPLLCSDSVYIHRLYSLPSVMELAYNPIVKRYIEMYANRLRTQVSFMLGKGQYYFPYFEDELNKEGLPLELKYLPVIESALNPVARSRVGAGGLWQFMPATGRMYKLEINSLVDERSDPIKSTEAAVKYLKDMFAVYGDWNLVIAAYNCGPGNVNKAIRRSGGQRDYWSIYPYLPKETRGYVPAFIAATYIMNYYTEHNICPADSPFPSLVDTLEVDKYLHLQQIADMIDVPIGQLRELNPQYVKDIVPGGIKSYAINLPIQTLTAFIEKGDTIFKHRADEFLTHRRVVEARGSSAVGGSAGGSATYKVKKGDTLGGIASRHRVSIAQLKSWNGLRSDNLSIGKRLVVSAAPRVVAQKKKAPEKTESNTENITGKDKTTVLVADRVEGVLRRVSKVEKEVVSNYKVKRNDTWTAIAKNTGARKSDIKQWNSLVNDKLVAGKVFKIKKIEVQEIEDIVDLPDANLLLEPSSVANYFSDYVDGLENILDRVPNNAIGLDDSGKFVILGDDEDEFGFELSEGVEDEVENASIIQHQVMFGETISHIAGVYGVTTEDILRWNDLLDATGSREIKELTILLPQSEKVEQINDNKQEGRAA